jgi:hypothetical protein
MMRLAREMDMTTNLDLVTYTENVNTSQQELLCLSDTYAQADMQEIHQKSRQGYIKTTWR